MRLQYIGHSCFRLISEIGTTVVCDPFDGQYVGLHMPQIRCDLATLSHHHRDHDCTDTLYGGFAVLDEPVACAADDIAVQAVETYHDDKKGALRGKNLVFCFVVDGLRVVHLGDIGFVDEKIVKACRGCDVLMVPVGGVYTVDAAAAKRLVDCIQPKIAVPMHFMTDKHKFALGDLGDFLALFDADCVRVEQGCTLELSDTPQNEKTQVVVLSEYID